MIGCSAHLLHQQVEDVEDDVEDGPDGPVLSIGFSAVVPDAIYSASGPSRYIWTYSLINFGSAGGRRSWAWSDAGSWSTPQLTPQVTPLV